MDISVPDREISVLDSNKIPKNWKNWNSLWGSKDYNIQKLTYFSNKGHKNEQYGKVS